MGNTGYTCIRRTFCSLNALIWICGCCFLGIGLWLHFSYQGYATLLPHNPVLSAESLFIAFGVMSLVVSFFGCCGSWFESRCLLIIYFSLIILLFLSEFIVAIIVFVFRIGLGRMLANEMKYGLERHYNHTDRGGLIAPSVAAIYDHIQSELHCCGVHTYEDWYGIASWPGERWVPKSCCRPRLNESLIDAAIEASGDGLVNVDCTKARDPALWWDQGCLKAIQIWFVQRLHIVGSIGLVIGFLQLFGLIASMLLFCTIKHLRSSDSYKSYSPQVDSSLQRNNRSTSYLDD